MRCVSGAALLTARAVSLNLVDISATFGGFAAVGLTAVRSGAFGVFKAARVGREQKDRLSAPIILW